MPIQITETNRESQRKKVMHQDYSLGKRIWEMEQSFNEAVVNKDPYMAEYYNRKIGKLYAEAGISETGGMSTLR